MCSGRVDLEFVLKAFLTGQDGIFIGGCRLGECNYITHGNYHALNMVALCRGIMEYLGINRERLDIEFMSSGDGILLAERINHFTGEIKKLGPSELSPEIKSGLEEVIRLIPYLKIKCREKLSDGIREKKDISKLFTTDEIAQIFKEVPTFHINPEKCKACMICKSRCPVEAIDGAKKQAHTINQEKCIKCGTCIEVCPPKFTAVEIKSGAPLPRPISKNAGINTQNGKMN